MGGDINMDLTEIGRGADVDHINLAPVAGILYTVMKLQVS
jgi:hypothetical protein